MIIDAHEKLLHSGLNSVVTYIRQTYWIPAIRQTVKKILNKCVVCRRVIGKPYRAPDPPPLPKMRLEDAPPFTVCGIDFTGALLVKNSDGTLAKAYICLFTCANTRALHLEVVPNLTENSFIQAFRRFASRKSLPRTLISDNATTFTAGSEELKRLCNSQTLKETLSSNGIEWKFIPKRAPWYGGFWERLIALTKTTLKKILGHAQITMETLQTLITEIECVLNDRPLTYPSSDIKDSEVLTPAHLLYGRKITTVPYPQIDIDLVNFDKTPNYNKQMKRQTELIEHFRVRWKTEYLTSLREFHKTSGYNEQSIRIGDVVQIQDDNVKRIHWKIGIISDLIRGNDGLVRAAHIRTKTGDTTRPIVKLYPLEVSDVSDNSKRDSEGRPKREASEKARLLIRKWCQA